MRVNEVKERVFIIAIRKELNQSLNTLYREILVRRQEGFDILIKFKSDEFRSLKGLEASKLTH
jgi:hypothetical protein